MPSQKKDLFADVALPSPQDIIGSLVKDVIIEESPLMTSVDWNDFVMSKFAESELIDGKPLVAGLRRVAELLLGKIKHSGPQQVFPVTSEKMGRATVVWQIIFENGSSYSDVADCWEGNTDDEFCLYAVATAATRAEGRALRKALRLKSIAAEEITKKNTAELAKTLSSIKIDTEGEYENASKMTDPQANLLDKRCEHLNINVPAFFKEVFNSSIDKITKKAASDAIDKLNEYSRGSTQIPKSILSYEKWRN